MIFMIFERVLLEIVGNGGKEIFENCFEFRGAVVGIGYMIWFMVSFLY